MVLTSLGECEQSLVGLPGAWGRKISDTGSKIASVKFPGRGTLSKGWRYITYVCPTGHLRMHACQCMWAWEDEAYESCRMMPGRPAVLGALPWSNHQALQPAWKGTC